MARRGYHLSREYSVDPLEILFVREVMRDNIAALPANATVASSAATLHGDHRDRGQLLYPVIDSEKKLVGVVTRDGLQQKLKDNPHSTERVSAIARKDPVVAYDGEPLRLVVYRMADKGVTRMPVVSEKDGSLMGMVSLQDLLRARTRNLEEERRRERVLRIHFPFGAKVG